LKNKIFSLYATEYFNTVCYFRYSPGLKKAQNVEGNLESSIYDNDQSLIKRLFLPSSLNTTHDTYHIVCVLVVSASRFLGFKFNLNKKLSV
jgi:hypothetical protein